MAGSRVEVLLLLLLTGTLLLVSVCGWERVDEAHPHTLYEPEEWEEVEGITSLDSDDEIVEEEDEIPEGAILESEDFATGDTFDRFEDLGSQVDEDFDPRKWADATDTFDRFEDLGSQVDEEDFDPRKWADATDTTFQVDFEDAPPETWPGSASSSDFQGEYLNARPRTWSGSSSSDEIDVVCSETDFEIILSEELTDVKILGSKDLPILDAGESCGYELNSLTNTLTVPFTGCNVKKENDGYSLELLFTDESDQAETATVSCLKSNSDLSPPATGRSTKCNPTSTLPKAQNCDVSMDERLACGHPGISYLDCEKRGCCMDLSTSACYYPMDECSGDQHFVFAIRYDCASIPVDPRGLVIPGHPECKPVIVNDKVAIFKFKVTECGTHVYEVGEMKIYLAEVQTVVRALSLKYGIITRSDPLRFMIECRYNKHGSVQQSLVSVGYMVKTPTSSLPSAVISYGLYAVQLRIAKDQSYTSYFPTYHPPLRLLLGTPIYLELNLKSPKPDAVILVNYCVAYPYSAKNALVLLYEGCANPHDPTVSILKNSDSSTNRHQKRFKVIAFQFMEQTTNKYLDEEIYFMCSTEVCWTTEKTCDERCFIF